MGHALNNQPMMPEVYRLAFYLYGRLRLIRAAVLKSHLEGDPRDKRPHEHGQGQMISTRSIRAPVVLDPNRPDIVAEHDCDVIMAEVEEDDPDESPDDVKRDKQGGDGGIPSEENSSSSEELTPDVAEQALVLESWESPSLAILDSGCTKTLHGSDWSARFEAELQRRGLDFEKLEQKQSFKGVGGKITSKFVKVYPIGILTSKRKLYYLAPRVRKQDPHFSKSLEKKGNSPKMRSMRSFKPIARSTTFLKVGARMIGAITKIMRQEVDDLADGHPDGEVSEDVNYIEEILLTEPHLKKRATSKKGKRLDSLSFSLDGDDWKARRILAGKSVASKQPPYGKTWMKQIFAGQMGLSILCVYAGMMIGTPLDISFA